MGRKKKISSAVLNLRTHPHSPERYVELMADFYAEKTAIKLHGDRFGMISLINREPTDERFISGIITTFVNIETDGRWFDASGMQEATDEQISEVSIPNNLHPNAASFYFEFDINKHRLFVQTYSEGKSLSANQAQSLFAGLAESDKIKDRFGNIHVTVVQSKEGLDNLFSIPVIKEIRITIYKPNPDIFADDFEQRIEAHLAETVSQSVTVTYKADQPGSVNPTDEIRDISEIALENGEVEVKGRDENGAVRKSTQQLPAEMHDKFDPEEITERGAFRRLIPTWLGG